MIVADGHVQSGPFLRIMIWHCSYSDMVADASQIVGCAIIGGVTHGPDSSSVVNLMRIYVSGDNGACRGALIDHVDAAGPRYMW